MAKITVQNTDISVVKYNEEDYISLTDMARSQLQEHIIFRWLSLKSTIEYLGEWEMLYNPDFNCTEFGTIKNAAGSNNFVLSVKTWIERTGAIGIRSKAGRYGGTYAHRDIAYHFGMWISPKFQLLLVKEYQRLKTEEQRLLGWSAKRELSKINYRIHTDAIKQNLIPMEVTPMQASIIYANEADVLNVAMFGMTAKQWREANPEQKGNIRDYATINELICLSNMENLNAVFIEQNTLPIVSVPKKNSLFGEMLQFSRSMYVGSFVIKKRQKTQANTMTARILPAMITALFFFAFFIFSTLYQICLSCHFYLFHSWIDPFTARLVGPHPDFARLVSPHATDA